jgi:hypothetical protein
MEPITVRMPHAPPTDPELSAADIDTGPQSPQLSFQLLKAGDAKQSVRLAYGLGILLLGLAAMPLSNGDLFGGGVIGGFAAFSFAIGKFLSGRTHQLVRFGFDWKTNTFWCEDPETLGNPRLIPNANLITGLRLEYDHVDKWEHVEGNRSRTHYSQVYAGYVDGGRDYFLRNIYGKKDGPQVLAVLTQLLNQRG